METISQRFSPETTLIYLIIRTFLFCDPGVGLGPLLLCDPGVGLGPHARAQVLPCSPVPLQQIAAGLAQLPTVRQTMMMTPLLRGIFINQVLTRDLVPPSSSDVPLNSLLNHVIRSSPHLRRFSQETLLDPSLPEETMASI